MNQKSLFRSLKMTTLTVLAGGSLLLGGCTMTDVQKNVVAGSLGFVKSGVTAFWNAFIPVNDIANACFEQGQQ